MLLEISAAPSEPFELERVLIGGDLIALWNVSVHDWNSADHSLHDPHIFAVRPFVQSVNYALRFEAAQCSHPVVALHAAKESVIASTLQSLERELCILHRRL